MLRFFDGFDHYNSSSQAVRKYSVSNNSYLTQVTPGRLNDGACLNITAAPGQLYKDFERRAGYIMGAAWKYHINSGNGVGVMLYCRDSATGNQFSINLTLDRHLTLVRVTDGAVLATSSNTLDPDTWYFLEIKASIGAAGSVEVRVNKQPVLTYAGNTQSTPAAGMTAFVLRCPSTGTWSLWDDFYVCADQGTTGNDYLGDVHVYTVYPAQDARADFTPSVAGPGFSMVSDPVPDDDTTYLASGTPGHVSSFGVPAPASGNHLIHGAQVNEQARKDEAASRQIATLCKPAGTSDQVGSTVSLTTSWGNYLTLYPVNPATGDPWTPAEIAAAEWGVKEVA
jgi:hypothetical protein